MRFTLRITLLLTLLVTTFVGTASAKTVPLFLKKALIKTVESTQLNADRADTPDFLLADDDDDCDDISESIAHLVPVSDLLIGFQPYYIFHYTGSGFAEAQPVVNRHSLSFLKVFRT